MSFATARHSVLRLSIQYVYKCVSLSLPLYIQYVFHRSGSYYGMTIFNGVIINMLYGRATYESSLETNKINLNTNSHSTHNQIQIHNDSYLLIE